MAKRSFSARTSKLPRLRKGSSKKLRTYKGKKSRAKATIY